MKKKRIIEKLIDSQKGTLNKFVTSNKQNVVENVDETFVDD